MRWRLLPGLAALLIGLGCAAVVSGALAIPRDLCADGAPTEISCVGDTPSHKATREDVGSAAVEVAPVVASDNAERSGSTGASNLWVPAELWEFWSSLLSLTQSRLPPRPTLFSASTAPSGAIGLGWGIGPSDITKWEYRRRAEGGDWSDWTEIAAADAATGSHTVSDLGRGVRYSFQLRAVNANRPGPASATVSAVAGWDPPAPSEPNQSGEHTTGPVHPTLFYSLISSTSEAVKSGSYAFLVDAHDLSSGATSFAEMDAAEALLINTIGHTEDDYSDVLAAVRAGEQLMWFPLKLGGACWYAYRVMEILPAPPAPPRKLFRVELEAKDPCDFALTPNYDQGESDSSRSGYHFFLTSFRQGALPGDPYSGHVGADGIRRFPHPRPQGMGGYPVDGGQTYRLGDGVSLSSILIDVPEEVTLALYDEGIDYAMYLDEASGAYLRLNPFTGKDAEYFAWVDGERAPAPDGAAARFEAIIASIRVSPLPGPQHRPGTPTLAARTAASGSVALNWSRGPADARHWEYRQRSDDGGWGEWIRIAGFDASTASHTIAGLTEDARYSFQVRAADARARGPASAAASAVAGLTPTLATDPEPLWYNRLRLTDGAVSRGAYAFLTDAADLTSGAATFAETSGAVALLINTEGSLGRDYTAELATVQSGDLLSWSRDNDNFDFHCRYDWRVIEVLPDPPPPARRLFRIALEDESRCDVSAAEASDPDYFNRARGYLAAFEWEDPSPAVGADGVRLISPEIEGGHTYRMVAFGNPTSILVDVPAGMRLTYAGGILYTDGRLTETFIDEVSGWSVTLSPFHVWDAYCAAPTSDETAEQPPGMAERCEALLDSIRVAPLP